MDMDSKPTEMNIVLVHDKILMGLLGANSIMPIFHLTTGWYCDDPADIREPYLAYRQTKQVQQIINDFEAGTINVSLEDYLSATSELEGYIGRVEYIPRNMGVSSDEGV